MIALMIIPLVFALFLSLHFVTFQNINAPEFVKWANYKFILSDPDFRNALIFSMTIVVVAVPVIILLGLFIAILMDQTSGVLRGLFMTMILLPFVVVPVVGALMFKQMFEIEGALAFVHKVLTGKSFVLTPFTVRVLVLLHTIWSYTPYPIIVFFAGLQGLPETRLEAAEVDGANRWQQLFCITIPHLKPILIMTVMILTMDMYRIFDNVLVMSEQNPIYRAENLMMYNFRIGMQMMRLGRANATAILTVAGVMIVLVPFLRMTYKNQMGKN